MDPKTVQFLDAKRERQKTLREQLASMLKTYPKIQYNSSISDHASFEENDLKWKTYSEAVKTISIEIEFIDGIFESVLNPSKYYRHL